MSRPKGSKNKVVTVAPKYAKDSTDFDQVAMFQQLFANIFDRNRNLSIVEVLDFILGEGGVTMNNKDLMKRVNMLGMRVNLHTPSPNEDEDKKAME